MRTGHWYSGGGALQGVQDSGGLPPSPANKTHRNKNGHECLATHLVTLTLSFAAGRLRAVPSPSAAAGRLNSSGGAPCAVIRWSRRLFKSSMFTAPSA
eukprot:7860191-Alexandrium_andersonii.AAC.1